MRNIPTYTSNTQIALNILALETSTEFCSVALNLDGKISYKEVLAERRHSEILLPMIQELLSETGLILQQIDGIAFGAGPGSFTGVRIACGIAQGLAYAIDLPAVGVSTLEAVAQQIGKQKVIVALDARMNEIYYAAYQNRCDDHWETINEPRLCTPDHAPSLPGNDWHGCGSGFDIYGNKLTDQYHKQLQNIHYGLHPQAREIALLAVSKLNNKDSDTNPINVAPIYIRNKVALKEKER